MSEERSPLVQNGTNYGTIQNGGHNSSYAAIDGASDIQVDESTSGVDPTATAVSSNADNEAEQMRSTLSSVSKLGFGLGHVYNDLCAGVWFSYTLLFLQGALLVPGAEAGALMMLGQVGDAIATPIVGYLADRYGTKRKWHIFGMIANIAFAILITDPWR